MNSKEDLLRQILKWMNKPQGLILVADNDLDSLRNYSMPHNITISYLLSNVPHMS